MGDLLDPANVVDTEDHFAVARAALPGCKYIRCMHPAGFSYVMAIPRSSGWFDLLPDEQTVEIVLKTQ